MPLVTGFLCRPIHAEARVAISAREPLCAFGNIRQWFIPSCAWRLIAHYDGFYHARRTPVYIAANR